MAVSKTTDGPKIHRLAYFWPGLPMLWIRGSWAGLLVAVGFTALANVLLLSTLVFREWLTLQARLIVFAALTIVWLLARWQSRAQRNANLAVEDDLEQPEGSTEPLPAERDVLFREAQGHYLRNDWVATEQLLLRLLKQDARDVECRLMLATLWRHQGRLAEATRQLDRLSRLEAAERWQHEIAAERVAINEAAEIHAEVQDDEGNGPAELTELAINKDSDETETNRDETIRNDTEQRRAA